MILNAIAASNAILPLEINLQVMTSEGKATKANLTIKFKIIAQSEALKAVVQDASAASQHVASTSGIRSAALDKADAVGSRAKGVMSSAEPWGHLIINIELFVNAISALAEVCPTRFSQI